MQLEIDRLPWLVTRFSRLGENPKCGYGCVSIVIIYVMFSEHVVVAFQS